MEPVEMLDIAGDPDSDISVDPEVELPIVETIERVPIPGTNTSRNTIRITFEGVEHYTHIVVDHHPDFTLVLLNKLDRTI